MTERLALEPRPASAPAAFEKLVETAKDYARGAKAENTNRAYAADWRHYTSWCRRQGGPPLPPEPQMIGLYLAACASEPPPGSRRGAKRRPRCAPSSGVCRD